PRSCRNTRWTRSPCRLRSAAQREPPTGLPPVSVKRRVRLDQREELGPCPWIRLERAEHCARDRNGILLLHAAHGHAQMRALHHHADAERIDLLVDDLRDLIGEALLDLQAATEGIDDARDLAEANDAVAWEIRNVTLAEEGQQMMLAQAIEVDVLDNHHFA